MRNRRNRPALFFASLSIAVLAGAAHAGEAIERHAERGPVQVDLSIEPAEPMIGDVIELDLAVSAEAGVEVFMPEFGEALGRFEIVDFAPTRGQDDQGRSLFAQKYRLQPARSGPQTIPPLRVEFVDRREGRDPSPEGEDAYEILTERISIDVATILPEDAPLELRPRHADLGPRRSEWLRGWVWGLVFLAVVAGIAPFGWRAFVAARERQRRQSAYDVARAELDRLLEAGRPSDDTMDEFYVKLSLIVRTYLEDRFGLRSPELTTQEFLTEMGRSPDLARSHQKLLRNFLEQADLVKFAGHRPSAEGVSDSIAAADRFLGETRDFVRAQEALSPGASGGSDA
jgi:hypothetical protein